MGLMGFVSLNLIKVIKTIKTQSYSTIVKKPPWRVLFFGTDDFSIFSLKALIQEYRRGTLISTLEVVTTLKGKKSNPVKTLCEKEGLKIQPWPPELQQGVFDVGLVVSFGHLLPESIIGNFEYGMLNVHASLLPRWRGAAPIIYALANGDTESGVTIMQISPKKFDVGAIISQERIAISPHMRMPELHQILGVMGAKNLVKTLESLPENINKAKPQPEKGITYAPKILPAFACIKWETMTSIEIYNRGRALESFLPLQTTWKDCSVKLINVNCSKDDATAVHNFSPGFIQFEKGSNLLKILCVDFKFITVEKVGIIGKKVMSARDFNNGYLKKEDLNCRYFK